LTKRLDQQFAFLNEADLLKSIQRANTVLDGSRPENSAEHSWHVALWALIHADAAPKGCDISRAILMLLLHDIVDIDAGDHPIHLPNQGQSEAEAKAAKRLFALLPDDLAAPLQSVWQEFEAGRTPDASFAKLIDHTQPLFQVLCAADPNPDHVQIVRDNLATGRAADLSKRWPDAYAAARARLNGVSSPPASEFEQRLAFLSEADQLKHVLRGTTLCDGSRFENSGEHSWHIALYAIILADQSFAGITIARVIQMLLLHDLVEIDVGDVPIHSQGGTAHSSAEVEAAEAIAAHRLFGLLPKALGDHLHALWQEFEAVETPDANFAKSLDRVQPVMQNIQCGGGSWKDYNVTFAQLETRVGHKVAKGAPGLWDYVRRRTQSFFGDQIR
jgi:putative hydrolase of HD superfamily